MHALQSRGISVVTPKGSPNPSIQEGWCFSDTEKGIIAAVQEGATHLWANTVLFASHPLQTSSFLRRYAPQIRIIGQPPSMVDKFDDKAYLNDKLRQQGSFTLPRSWLVKESDDLEKFLHWLQPVHFPVVGKPVRGRGSHGVKVCQVREQLGEHLTALFCESSVAMVEQFLPCQEATITVMPPSPDRPQHWSLPPVWRFNHADGVAPYSGEVAVTKNSRVVTAEEIEADFYYGDIMRQCEQVAKLIQATAPIRIDIRRIQEEGKFALFDINMKPVRTLRGPPDVRMLMDRI